MVADVRRLPTLNPRNCGAQKNKNPSSRGFCQCRRGQPAIEAGSFASWPSQRSELASRRKVPAQGIPQHGDQRSCAGVGARRNPKRISTLMASAKARPARERSRVSASRRIRYRGRRSPAGRPRLRSREIDDICNESSHARAIGRLDCRRLLRHVSWTQPMFRCLVLCMAGRCSCKEDRT